MDTFIFIEHTADAGIRVQGKTLEEMFVHAAEGTVAYLGTVVTVPDTTSFSLRVEGIDHESLLVNWLNELLYQVTDRRLLPTRFTITALTSTVLTAEIAGRHLAPGAHYGREIKAVTYAGLKIATTGTGYTATVIFDI